MPFVPLVLPGHVVVHLLSLAGFLLLLLLMMVLLRPRLTLRVISCALLLFGLAIAASTTLMAASITPDRDDHSSEHLL